MLGEGKVFLDTLTIEPGEDFVEAIGEHVENCRVLLAIIGSSWVTELAAREAMPNDFVRIEIAQALSRGIRVVPVVIDHTPVPSIGELPAELEALTRLNAVRINAESFEADMAPLLGFLSRHLSQGVERSGAETGSAAANINLKHRTEYWKIGKDGRPRHRIFVSLDASDEVLQTISKVTYTLHPTFQNPIREVVDARNNFELRTNGWGEFEIKASVEFKDSSQGLYLSRQITFD